MILFGEDSDVIDFIEVDIFDEGWSNFGHDFFLEYFLIKSSSDILLLFWIIWESMSFRLLVLRSWRALLRASLCSSALTEIVVWKVN